MYRFKELVLRKFECEDIPKKIEWINNDANNKFLHYDLPLEYEKTYQWFLRNKDRNDRFDGVVEYLGEPVGLIGLLEIDLKNLKAEKYTVIGNTSKKSEGLGTRASLLILAYAFECLKLNKVVTYIEVGNEPSLKMNFKFGAHVEGYLRHDLMRKGEPLDRYVLGTYREEFHIPEDMYWED